MSQRGCRDSLTDHTKERVMAKAKKTAAEKQTGKEAGKKKPEKKYSKDTYIFMKPNAGTVTLQPTKAISVADSTNQSMTPLVTQKGIHIGFDAGPRGRGMLVFDNRFAENFGMDYDVLLKLLLGYEKTHPEIKLAVAAGELQKNYTMPLDEEHGHRGPTLMSGVRGTRELR